MGASSFVVRVNGIDAREAFELAVEQAQYDYGHSGYTGTIAEKNDFVMIELDHGDNPEDYAYKLINDLDNRISGKWGPAGCFALGNNEFMFFGWASS